MNEFLNTLWSDESGQDLVEYVLIIVLIAIAAVTAMTTLGTKVNDAFQNAADQVDSNT